MYHAACVVTHAFIDDAKAQGGGGVLHVFLDDYENVVRQTRGIQMRSIILMGLGPKGVGRTAGFILESWPIFLGSERASI